MILAVTTGTDPTITYLHGLGLVAQSDGTGIEYFAYDGLVFLRARYYNPTMGRFFQRDTWGGDNNRPQSLNPYMYALGNPILLTDPSGQIPMCDEPCQLFGNVSAEPYYTLDNGMVNRLKFEPAGGFLPARYLDPNLPYKPKSQFDIEGHRLHGNLCGPLAVIATIQNILGTEAPGLLELLDTLIIYPTQVNDTGITTEDDILDGTGWWHFYELVNEVPGVTSEPVEWPYHEIYGFRDDLRNGYDQYYTMIRNKLESGKWPLVWVGYSQETKTGRYVLDVLTGDFGHFIVITGLSIRELWERGEGWKWVRIYNPFVNGTEYYQAKALFDYQAPDLNTMYIFAE